jgi:hypothetical protein
LNDCVGREIGARVDLQISAASDFAGGLMSSRDFNAGGRRAGVGDIDRLAASAAEI